MSKDPHGKVVNLIHFTIVANRDGSIVNQDDCGNAFLIRRSREGRGLAQPDRRVVTVGASAGNRRQEDYN